MCNVHCELFKPLFDIIQLIQTLCMQFFSTSKYSINTSLNSLRITLKQNSDKGINKQVNNAINQRI